MYDRGSHAFIICNTKVALYYDTVILGLSLTLFVEQQEYVGVFSQTPGVRVVLHRQDQQPFPVDEGVVIGAGQKGDVKYESVGRCSTCKHICLHVLEYFMLRGACIEYFNLMGACINMHGIENGKNVT